MSLNLLLFLTESNDHPHHVADPLWKATFIMAHSNDSRLVASPSASCTLHVQSVFNSLWPTRHWLTLAPLSIFSFWTIVTLNTTKVFQFMGHNSVHEPVISNAQVLQNVSILTFLVLGILRNFLWHFSSKQQLRFLVLGILRIFLLDFTSKQQLRAHGQQKGRENPGLLTLKYGQGVYVSTPVYVAENRKQGRLNTDGFIMTFLQPTEWDGLQDETRFYFQN